MPRTKLVVTQDEAQPVEKEILATAICKLSDAMNQLQASGLNNDAIVVLLVDKTKMSKKAINRVMSGIAQLRADYTHA